MTKTITFELEGATIVATFVPDRNAVLVTDSGSPLSPGLSIDIDALPGHELTEQSLTKFLLAPTECGE